VSSSSSTGSFVGGMDEVKGDVEVEVEVIRDRELRGAVLKRRLAALVVAGRNIM
jgi:hypothetical protein